MSNIVLTHTDILEFYETYALDPEQINLLFISLLKDILENRNSNKSLGNQLMEKISSLDRKLESINKTLQDDTKAITTCFQLQFSEHRHKYIDDMKCILSSNQTEHLMPFLRDINQTLIDKIQILLNEVLPKHQDGILEKFQQALLQESKKLSESTINIQSMKEFMGNIELHFQNHAKQIETRLIENDKTLTKLNDQTITQQHSQTILQTNVSEMLKKFEKSTTKGSISENILYNVIVSLFPCAEIDYVGNEQKETGDIILIRHNKPKILIENKDHDSKNIPKHEIEKFIRDCEIQNCCGIMLAQNRGIANKENFELQIHKTNVLLYVHEVKFDQDKIKMAIDIVEHFKQQLDVINKQGTNAVLEKHDLENINKEYLSYVNQKSQMSKLLKDYNEKMTLCLLEMKMPTLDSYLSKTFATSFKQQDNVCKYCEKAILKSMKQHYRYCASKRDLEQQNESFCYS
jgi:hypothetical protein